MGWGFNDSLTTKLSLILVFLGAVVKFFGIMLANGEVYAQATQAKDSGDGAVIPTKGF